MYSGQIVLNSESKLMVHHFNGNRFVQKSSAENVLGYKGEAEHWLLDLLAQLSKYLEIPDDLLHAFKSASALSFNDGQIAVYKITDYLTACNLIIKAKENGFLYSSEVRFAKNAEIVVQYFNDPDPSVLIDAATGFQLEKYNLKRLLSDNAHQHKIDLAQWFNALDDEFLQMLFTHFGCHWYNAHNYTTQIVTFINKYIVLRVEDKLFDELRSSKPKRKFVKHQAPVIYLQHPELLKYFNVVAAFAVAADFNEKILDQLLSRVHPVRREANLYIPKQDQFSKMQNDPAVVKLSSTLEKILGL